MPVLNGPDYVSCAFKGNDLSESSLLLIHSGFFFKEKLLNIFLLILFLLKERTGITLVLDDKEAIF